MNTIIINLAGLTLIGFIVWWFWLSKPKARQANSDTIDILVENGTYSPSRIEIPVGQKTTLRFLRKDVSHCAEKVIFDRLNISTDLPLNKPIDIDITLPAAGEYSFSCQMKMYTGSLIAK